MLIYQYSGGLDGFLSAVFRAYQDRVLPDLITDGNLTQPPLSSQIVTVQPDETKALRIERGIHARLGMSGLHQLCYAFASGDPERNRKIFYWILSVFKYGKGINSRYHDAHVMDFCDMTARVTLELHHIAGALPFSQDKTGILWAEIAPNNNVLPFLIPYVIRKWNEQPFLIHDEKRGLYGIYNGSEWKVLYSERKPFPLRKEPEEVFQTLWKEYYRSAAIVAREKKRTQDAYLPCRYRAFLTEFQD